MLFILKILLNFCDLWKCFLTSFRKTLSVFVLIFKLYGGFNQMAFLLLFRFCVFKSCFEFHTVIKPPVFQSWFVKRFSLVEFIFTAWQIWNMSAGHRWQLLGDKRLMVWLRIDVDRGDVQVPIRRKFVHLFRLNETSRKSVSVKFVSMVIESPSDLNVDSDINVAKEEVICVWQKKWLLLQQIQKFCGTKEFNWYQNFVIETILFWTESNKISSELIW